MALPPVGFGLAAGAWSFRLLPLVTVGAAFLPLVVALADALLG